MRRIKWTLCRAYKKSVNNFWWFFKKVQLFRLSEYGHFVGVRLLDLLTLREAAEIVENFEKQAKFSERLSKGYQTAAHADVCQGPGVEEFVRPRSWQAGEEQWRASQMCGEKTLILMTFCFGLSLNKKIFFENHLISKDFLIEREPIVNTYISLPKDKGSLNCASFIAGIIEAFLTVKLKYKKQSCKIF